MKTAFSLFVLILFSITSVNADCYKETADKKKDFMDCVIYAKEGGRNAQYNLGVMYYFGEGTAENYSKAHHWYKKAAQQGYVYAQYSVGFMYQMGLGITKDYQAALQWYKRSAQQGYVYAQYSLGFMYHMGLGAKKDYQAALKWYIKAAEQENVGAQYNLGAMYSNGIGVELDYVKAHMYLNIATANGDKKAKKFRDVVAKVMTSAQRKEAKRLAFEWVDNH
jgi:hypothetical protein